MTSRIEDYATIGVPRRLARLAVPAPHTRGRGRRGSATRRWINPARRI